jgi:hypothetical protein
MGGIAMPLSLYSVTVTSFQQILTSLRAALDKGEAFGNQAGLPHDGLIEARLIEDMLPFAYQVKSTGVHSLGAMEGVRRGSFSPDMTTPPDSFDALRQRIDETLAGLAALDPAEIDGLVGRPMRFEMGDYKVDYTAEDFLLSFSIPNFYFHATTAYDILRAKGVTLGKADFLGRTRGKRVRPA